MKYGREFLPRYLRIVTSTPPRGLLDEAANEIERLQMTLKLLEAKCKHLESEVARFERASNG